jgi:hypothetical protein
MARPTSAAIARRCASEREDSKTNLEETRDGKEGIPGAFFSAVTHTTF